MPEYIGNVFAIAFFGFLVWVAIDSIFYARKRTRLLAHYSPEQQELLKGLESSRTNLAALWPFEPLTFLLRPIHQRNLERQTALCRAQGISGIRYKNAGVFQSSLGAIVDLSKIV